MYLHILDKYGKPLALLDTAKPLTPAKRADLVHTAERHQAIGVLSSEKSLAKLPRFSGNGEVKAAFLPKVFRGEALFDYLDKLVSASAPPSKSENLKPAWTKETAPRKVSKVTQEQTTRAYELRANGVAWRKVAEMVGTSKTALIRALA